MASSYDCCKFQMPSIGGQACDAGYLDYGTRKCDSVMSEYCTYTTTVNGAYTYDKTKLGSDTKCRDWCTKSPQACAPLIESICQDQGEFLSNPACQQYCLVGNEVNKSFCNTQYNKLCSQGNYFLLPECKKFCSNKANKALCNNIVATGCQNINNNSSYCNCYKKLTSFPNYTNMDKKYDGWTVCFAPECLLGDSYVPDPPQVQCPSCFQNLKVSGSNYSAKNITQTCNVEVGAKDDNKDDTEDDSEDTTEDTTEDNTIVNSDITPKQFVTESWFSQYVVYIILVVLLIFIIYLVFFRKEDTYGSNTNSGTAYPSYSQYSEYPQYSEY